MQSSKSKVQNSGARFRRARQFLFLIFAFSIWTLPAEAALIGKPSNLLTLNSGLVGHWTFDGIDMVNGVAQDKSGQGNHAYVSSMPTSTAYVSGKIGQALRFGPDNNGSVVAAAPSSSLNDLPALSFSAWVTFDSVYNVVRNIVAKLDDNSGGHGWTIRQDGANTLHFFHEMDGGTEMQKTVYISVPPIGQWTHIVMTWDGSANSSGVTFFQDGVTKTGIFSENNGVGNRISDASRPLFIGNGRDNLDQEWNGKIDDVRIYNRVLSASEARTLYNAGQSRVAKSSASRASGTLSNGLIGHWTFEAADTNWTTGAVADASGNGRTGYVGGLSTSTAPTNGRIGQAFEFDGLDDRVRVAGFDAPVEGTFAAWVSSDFSERNGPSNFPLLFDTSGTRTAVLFNGFGSPDYYSLYTNNIDTGRATYAPGADLPGWFHLAVTWSTSGSQFYKDGVAVGTSGVGDHSNTSSSTALYIGSRDDLLRWWDGKIDDVRIYNRPLSVSEIQQLYNLGQDKIAVTPRVQTGGGLNAGLVGYWTFDGKDMQDGVAQDKSGNGRHLTMVNMATATAYVPGKIGQGLRFDGVDDYLFRDTTMGITDYPYTLAGWGKTVLTTSAGQGIVWIGESGQPDRYSSIGTNISPMYGLQARYDGVPDIIDGAVGPDDQWHYVVGVYRSASDRELFIDGVSVGTDTTAWTVPAIDRVSVGAFRDSTPGDYFRGVLDDVRIYNRALSATEIRQLYNQAR